VSEVLGPVGGGVWGPVRGIMKMCFLSIGVWRVFSCGDYVGLSVPPFVAQVCIDT